MIRTTVLANGIKLLTEKVPGYRRVHVLFCYGTGSGAEQPHEWGAAHFLEHLMFSGRSDRAYHSFVSRMARLGAVINASTDVDRSVFRLEVGSEEFEGALSLYATWLAGFAINAARVDVERRIIEEEREMVAGDLQTVGAERLHYELLGPRAHPVLGTQETLEAMSAETLSRFYDRFYSPGNLVVSIAGNIDHDRAARILDRTLPVGVVAPIRHIEQVPKRERHFVHVPTESGQTHLFLGWRAPGRHDPHRSAFAVLARALAGDGTDQWARLFRRLRIKRGQVYTIAGYYQFVGTEGVFGLYAESTEDAKGVSSVMECEVRRVRRTGISRAELQRSVAMLKADLRSMEDSLVARAERQVDLAMYREEATFAEEMDRLNRVTVGEVLHVAEAYLAPQDSVLVQVGPDLVGGKLGRGTVQLQDE